MKTMTKMMKRTIMAAVVVPTASATVTPDVVRELAHCHPGLQRFVVSDRMPVTEQGLKKTAKESTNKAVRRVPAAPAAARPTSTGRTASSGRRPSSPRSSRSNRNHVVSRPWVMILTPVLATATQIRAVEW